MQLKLFGHSWNTNKLEQYFRLSQAGSWMLELILNHNHSSKTAWIQNHTLTTMTSQKSSIPLIINKRSTVFQQAVQYIVTIHPY
jgi:hypothetical protein